MSDIIDLDEMITTDALSPTIAPSIATTIATTMSTETVSGVIGEQITITEQDLKVYTTKNGSPWQQKDSKFLDDCILHENVDDAVQYAESNFCTIICVEDGTITWSGGPVKAKTLFSD